MAPRLIAHGRRVIAVDPRGVGRNEKPESGYTLVAAAMDMHELIGRLGLSTGSGIDILSYDLGSAITCALASKWPADVRRLMMSELTIPRSGQKQPLPTEQMNFRSWHFGFNRLPGLPEMLVAGRERLYLDFLWETKAVRPEAIEEDARREYAEALAQPGAAKASFDYYRDSFSDAGIQQLGEWLAKPLPMPVLAIGADGGVGPLLAASLAGSADDLRSVLVKNCGHFVPEEDPDSFVEAVLDFWAATDQS